MPIIISPSKEMTVQPQQAQRPPHFTAYAKRLRTGEELTDDTGLYRAIDLYNGLQFRYLRTGLSEADLAFLDDHLRILSAAYGVVKPFDGIRHYRKDFQTKGLYKAWGDKIYQSLIQENRPILNLASDEFSRTVTRYATSEDTIISVTFYEEDKDAALKKHASISKKGRGQMVNYIARNRIRDVEPLKNFDDLGYRFSHDKSDESHWVFIRPKDSL